MNPDEYNVTTIKDGKIVPVRFYDLERKIKQEQLADIYHDLKLLQDKLSEVLAAHFIEERAELPNGGKTLSDLFRAEIAKRGTFTVKEIKDAVTSVVKAEKLSYAQNSIDTTVYAVVKSMLQSEEVRKLDGSDKYFNVAFEEKEEIAEEEKDDISAAGVPQEGE